MPCLEKDRIDKLCAFYKSAKNISLFIEEENDKFSFNVKHRLNMDEALDMATIVCNGVVDKSKLDYCPELKDYYLRMAVIKVYTDIVLPHDTEQCWRFVYGTPVFAMITGHEKRPVSFDGRDYDDNMIIDVEQYEQLLAAIDSRIAFEIRS